MFVLTHQEVEELIPMEHDHCTTALLGFRNEKSHVEKDRNGSEECVVHSQENF